MSVSVCWLKLMLGKFEIVAEVLKLSGNCSTAFKAEAMKRFSDR